MEDVLKYFFGKQASLSLARARPSSRKSWLVKISIFKKAFKKHTHDVYWYLPN